ncbi:MAG TPA: LLM class flavin-dependent oxidoreductase [Ktedonobacterales bacterium]|nr:LLM class flavin-dependent oxidoreductase [Ktedonobacterales bacterium]
MRFAINLPASHAFADVHALADLAHEAEEMGWDGFFLWDHIQMEPNGPTADPWVALTAIAMKTERIRFGALVTPLPRRRPWKFARETATLDQLSSGRLTVGVGIGGDWWGEYSAFGEPATDNRTHAAMLDEALDVVRGLWSGQPFSYEGHYYTIHDAQFLPTPAQQPRIPIWVAGIWPHKAPMRRAARWDGVCPLPLVDGGAVTPDEVREILAYIGQQRASGGISGEPFDVVLAGGMGAFAADEAADRLRAYAEAGVTWWQEGFLPGDSLDDARERIRQGPPRL